MSGQPNSAAELLIAFRDRLGAALDIDRSLDLLARQIQDERLHKRGYRDYIRESESDAPYSIRDEWSTSRHGCAA